MSDLISRQAILEHIDKMRQGVQMMEDTHRACIVMNGMYLCEKAVRNQPSEQPEVIRCRDCKYYHPSFCEIWSKYGTVQTREAGYCYMAERRGDDEC